MLVVKDNTKTLLASSKHENLSWPEIEIIWKEITG